MPLPFMVLGMCMSVCVCSSFASWVLGGPEFYFVGWRRVNFRPGYGFVGGLWLVWSELTLADWLIWVALFVAFGSAWGWLPVDNNPTS